MTNDVRMGGCKYLHDMMDYPQQSSALFPNPECLSIALRIWGRPFSTHNALSVMDLKIGHIKCQMINYNHHQW